MLGTFGGFNTAISGLFAYQKAMSTTSHNVANAKTPGFTRQQTIFETNVPFPMPSMNRPGGAGQLGMGVNVSQVTRIRDLFLDKQIRAELSNLGLNEQLWSNLDRIQTLFLEPSNKDSLGGVIDQFWTAWNELSKNAEDTPIRTTVKDMSKTLAESLNHIASQLEVLHRDNNEIMDSKAMEVNSIASQIAALNEKIYAVRFAGDNPNDLYDERDNLLDRLSKLVDVTVKPVLDKKTYAPDVIDTGMIEIELDGKDLVYGQYYNKIFYNWDKGNLDDPALSQEKFYWASNGSFDENTGGVVGNTLYFNQGEIHNDPSLKYGYDPDIASDRENLRASAITVTSTGVTYTTIPGGNLGTGLGQIKPIKGEIAGIMKSLEQIKTYNERLDSYAFNLALAINQVLKNGAYDLDNNLNTADFFVRKDGVVIDKTDPASKKNAARQIDLNSLFEDVSKIPVSAVSDAPGNGDKALEIYKLATKVLSAADGVDSDVNNTSLNKVYENFIAALGIDAASAKRNVSTQSIAVDQLQDRRESVSGVNIDEEMTNMIQYQKSYEASAKMITTLDEMLQTILNLKR